jgi:hypothetical protein
LPISAFNQTLSLFHKQVLHQHTAGIIVPTKSPTTNYNTSKPDILRQLFKQIVLNNRSSNKRQKDMPFCPIYLILYMCLVQNKSNNLPLATIRHITRYQYITESILICCLINIDTLSHRYWYVITSISNRYQYIIITNKSHFVVNALYSEPVRVNRLNNSILDCLVSGHSKTGADRMFSNIATSIFNKDYFNYL